MAVDESLVDKWRGWLMPAEQPFVVPGSTARELGLESDRRRLSPELRDSFNLYGLPRDRSVCWLSHHRVQLLPREVRRSQPAPHHWPTGSDNDADRVVRLVERGRRPSRHREVDEQVWRRVSSVLPSARGLAGAFASKSGPNCFGTVMAAAGETGAADIWMQRDPFERWLAAATREGGRDSDPGTVLVWRGSDHLVQHAVVTLGEGWALHKASQGWMSPTVVLDVTDAKFSSRSPGHHLERRRVVS